MNSLCRYFGSIVPPALRSYAIQAIPSGQFVEPCLKGIIHECPENNCLDADAAIVLFTESIRASLAVGGYCSQSYNGALDRLSPTAIPAAPADFRGYRATTACKPESRLYVFPL